MLLFLQLKQPKSEIASSHDAEFRCIFLVYTKNECERHERFFKIASRNMLIHLERSWKKSKACNLVSNENFEFFNSINNAMMMMEKTMALCGENEREFSHLKRYLAFFSYKLQELNSFNSFDFVLLVSNSIMNAMMMGRGRNFNLKFL